MTNEPKKFTNTKLEEFLRTKIIPDEDRESLRTFLKEQIERTGSSADSVSWRFMLGLMEDSDAWRRRAELAEAAFAVAEEKHDQVDLKSIIETLQLARCYASTTESMPVDPGFIAQVLAEILKKRRRKEPEHAISKTVRELRRAIRKTQKILEEG